MKRFNLHTSRPAPTSVCRRHIPLPHETQAEVTNKHIPIATDAPCLSTLSRALSAAYQYYCPVDRHRQFCLFPTRTQAPGSSRFATVSRLPLGGPPAARLSRCQYHWCHRHNVVSSHLCQLQAAIVNPAAKAVQPKTRRGDDLPAL